MLLNFIGLVIFSVVFVFNVYNTKYNILCSLYWKQQYLNRVCLKTSHTLVMIHVMVMYGNKYLK